jgi:hypothetical protein
MHTGVQIAVRDVLHLLVTKTCSLVLAGLAEVVLIQPPRDGART